MKINEENLKFLGKGIEKKVYENPHNPERAVGVFHVLRPESQETIKARFYLTKIIHLLFPKNIPDMHSVTSDPKTIEVDKIDDDGSLPAENLKRFVPNYHSLVEKLYDLGLAFDHADVNYKFDKKGDFYYVDSFLPWHSRAPEEPPFLHIEKLKAEIEKLDPAKKELALGYLDRLMILHKEHLEKLNKKK